MKPPVRPAFRVLRLPNGKVVVFIPLQGVSERILSKAIREQRLVVGTRLQKDELPLVYEKRKDSLIALGIRL